MYDSDSRTTPIYIDKVTIAKSTSDVQIMLTTLLSNNNHCLRTEFTNFVRLSHLAFGESDPMPGYIRFRVCAIDLTHLVELHHGDTSRMWWTHQPFAADVNHDLAKGICRSLRDKVFGGNFHRPLRRAHLYGIFVYSIKNDNSFAFVRQSSIL